MILIMSRFKIKQSYGGRKQAHEVACDKIAKCEKSYFQPQANQALADMLWTMMNIHNYLNSLINNYVADRQISLYILQKSSCYTHNSVANVSHEIHNSVANKVHTLQCEYMWPCHPFSALDTVGWVTGRASGLYKSDTSNPGTYMHWTNSDYGLSIWRPKNVLPQR